MDKQTLLIVAILMLVGIMAYGQFSPQAQATLQTGGKVIVEPGVANECPSTYLTKLSLTGYESVLNSSTGTKVPVPQNAYANIYRNGDTGAYDTIKFSSTGAATSTSGKELTCATDEYRIIAGNDTATGLSAAIPHYYFTEVGPFKAQKAVDNVEITLDKIGNVSILGYTTGGTPVATKNYGTLVAGASTQDVELEIKEKTGAVWRNPAIFVNYNTTAFDRARITGTSLGTTITEANIPTRLSSYEKGYDLGIPMLSNFEKVTTYMDVAMKSGISVLAAVNTCTTAAEAGNNGCIGMIVVDKGTYILDGKLSSGYEDKAQADVGALDSIAFYLNASTS